MTPVTKRGLGNWGEELAANFLISQDYTILDRNIHTPYGEIDLLACKGGVYIFVEVKTRSNLSFGYPEEAITPEKRLHLLQSAQYILQEKGLGETSWQIDVIAIHRKSEKNVPEIVWYENAVS